MFQLRYYDIPLIDFEILEDSLDGQSCNIKKIYSNTELLPIGLKQTNDGLMSWLKSRVIPKNREFVDSFLAKNGLSHNNTRGIIEISKGLSLNDCYWIVDIDFNGLFKDYNLYDNDFLKILSLIAYTGYGSSNARGFSSSPEFTTNGMLRKGWRRIKGKIYLYKGGTSGAANTGNEPYCEFYASQIAEKMGLNHVHYDLAMWKKSLCSTCELFTDINHSYVPIYRFFDKTSLKEIANYLKTLGSDIYNEFANMMVFDSLIYNEDRHLGNFGLMIDNCSNSPYGFAPLFDHGLSLFNFAMKDDFKNIEEYAKTRRTSTGASFDDVAKEFITERQKQQLRKLIGFKFTLHSSYNMPAWRVKALEEFIQKRIKQLLDM